MAVGVESYNKFENEKNYVKIAKIPVPLEVSVDNYSTGTIL